MPSSFQKTIQKIAALPLVSSLVLKPLLHRLDHPFMQRSRGKTSLTSLLTGLPVITLHTTGAKSGLTRSVPLVGIPDGEHIVVIASKFGHPRHPAWYYNLLAHPRVQATIAGKVQTLIASEAQGEARTRYWHLAVDLYPGYTVYQQQAGKRLIPVMVLSPS